MAVTLAHRNSSEGTQGELCNEYEHDRFKMVIKNICIRVVHSLIIGRVKTVVMKRVYFGFMF